MEPIEELEKWEQTLSEWIDALRKRILGVNSVLLERIYEFIDRFDFKLSLGENLTVLLAAQNTLPTLTQSAGFGVLVGELVGKIGESLGRLEEYFQKVFSNYPEKGAEVTNVFRTALEGVRRSLLGEGIQQNYVSEIVKTLQFHVYSKSQKSVFREALKRVLGENGQPIKYMTTYANDALYQFSRAYTEEMTKALGAKHYYYMGTRIKTTREFCNVRVGKAYTKAEVQAWAKREWSGKIPGTTAQSIMMYAGGYNCRHRILPISKEMYEAMGGGGK